MIPQSLEHRLRKGEVLPFVGAGISRAVLKPDGQPLFPGWRDLLLHAADLLDKEGKGPESQVVRGLLGIGQPDYLDAARRARDGLGPLWPEFLREEIDRRFEDADPESLALARAVWDLGNPLIVTTNYDKVLQWACPESLAKDLDFWDIEAKVEQGQLIRTGRPARPTIWHLHGRIGNAAELILTPDGYKRLYDDGSEGRYKAALRTFQTLLTSKSLLFIGFSFEDDALGVQLEGVNELFAGAPGPHYALVHTKDMSRLRALNLPVELISFAEFGEPLVELVKELGKITKLGDAFSASFPSKLVPVSSLPGASYSTDNRPFFVPFRAKGNRVIGAEQALRRVRDQLTQGRPTSIGQTAAFQGLGGLGKTQLAVEYSWRFSEEYANGVIWLTADQDIPAQLTRLAVEARWVASESEHKVKLEIAQHRLRSYSGCLIVFDNVEDLATLEPYLPLPSAQPHLLATSRTEQPGFVPVPLDILDEEQSLALLTSEAGRSPIGEQEDEAAREIARELGGLPLALEMAGAYLMYRSVQWQQYRNLLRNNPKEAFRPQLLASFTRHEADLFATLRIQEGLFEDEPLLRGILDVLTWSGSAPMGLSLLAAVLNAEQTDLLSALSLGVQLRLLERSSEDRYGLHRLVRKVRQEDRPLKEDPTWAEEICHRLGDWFFTRRVDFADLSTFEAEIDHLQSWREQAMALDSIQASRLTWLLAYPPFHLGHYAESHQWLDKALALFEGEDNSDPELNAWILNDLGTVILAEGHWRQALELNERALAIRRKTLGEEHPDTARSLLSVGELYKEGGDLDAALNYQTQALSIQRKVLGEEHSDTVMSLGSIGSLYIERGDLDGALDYLTQALAIRQKVQGEDHHKTAVILQSIASVYSQRRAFNKALDYFTQALAIMRKVLGEEHPATGAALNNVGLAYYSLGGFDKAFDYYTQALAITRKVLGEEHPSTATELSNIGIIYRKRGEFTTALHYYTRALNIRGKILGEKHPATVSALDEIGGLYLARGDVKQALEFGRRTLQIRMEAQGPSHTNTITSVLNVVSALRHLGHRKEAFEIIAPYIQNPPSDPEQAGEIKSLAQRLKAEPFRPGFRLPPASGKKKTKKRRRR
ncbi:MAG: hypothetical protein QOF89_384 [Acidobacteriota bacterium]|jgi:tetratricopeptide (TPR) repeat protein|nr:hypothetical protein [Acidobacteriota bacterium]